MDNVKHNTRQLQVCVLTIALSAVFGWLATSLYCLAAQAQHASGTTYSSRRMSDGKEWMTQNLDVDTVPSYCFQDVELNCRRYGRLYTWEAAQRACRSLEGE